MYKINTKVDKPDIKYMRERIEEVARDGFRVSDDIQSILDILNADLENNKKQVMSYGIKNPNSAAQVIAYLQSLKDPNVAECCIDGKGKWSSNRDCLAKLAHKGNDFAVDLLTYRKSTEYVKSVKQLVDTMGSEHIVRPQINYGKTNRVNYANPAIMNIPKDIIWDLIVPSKEGNVLVSVDIKNQEPWILINMLHIKSLKDVLKDNSEGGLYNALYKIIFGTEPTPIQRKEFKTSWNALTYGSTKKAIVETYRNIDGAKVYSYFTKIPELAEYKTNCYKLATAKKKDTHTLFGTELIADGDAKGRLQRQLMDLPIQGTGADILALLIKHFDDETEEKGLADKMWVYFTRHDELVIEVDGKAFEEMGEEKVFEILRDLFEHQIDDWEPFKVEICKIEKKGLIDAKLFEQLEDDDEFII